MENAAGKNYFRVRIRNLSETLEDIVTTLAMENGATGVSEALAFSQPDLTYEPEVVHARHHEIDVFFTVRPSASFILELERLKREQHHLLSWDVTEEESKDWLEEWKKGFTSFKLVGDFWVVPSWLKAPSECKHPLLIDPGMAFGTGTHATTQIAAYFIFHLVKKLAKEDFSKISEPSALDVGTGTAILAMLARQCGFPFVTGLEIDPEARRTARENILRNSLDDIDIPEKPLEEIRAQFEVVIANIIDGVLVHLKNDLLRVTRPGGFLILSGILQERDNYFFENFIENSNLQVLRRIEKDEWVGYLLKRPEA